LIQATKTQGKSPKSKRHRQSPGVIRADECYTVREFRRRAGLGDFAWREIRKKLRVVTIGRKQFVLGADWLRFLESQTQDHA
jgi:hypothetical protein